MRSSCRYPTLGSDRVGGLSVADAVTIPVYYDEDGCHVAEIPANAIVVRHAGVFSPGELEIYRDLGRTMALHFDTARAAEEHGCGPHQ